MMTAWMLPLSPLIRVSSFSGAICGRMAPTAGIWMPAPNARMADVAKRIQMERCPAKNSRTSTKVESAMMPSERTIRRFRL